MSHHMQMIKSTKNSHLNRPFQCVPYNHFSVDEERMEEDDPLSVEYRISTTTIGWEAARRGERLSHGALRCLSLTLTSSPAKYYVLPLHITLSASCTIFPSLIFLFF